MDALEEQKAAGRDPTHGATAAARRAETNITRKREARKWDEQHAWPESAVKKLAELSLSQAAEERGVSLNALVEGALRSTFAPEAVGRRGVRTGQSTRESVRPGRKSAKGA